MTGPNLATIEQALAELGSTSREVADTLGAVYKIRSTMIDPAHCAIADWLKYRLSAGTVSVGGNTCSVDGVSCDLPECVALFIDEFDDGAFPELVDGAVPYSPGAFDDDDDDPVEEDDE